MIRLNSHRPKMMNNKLKQVHPPSWTRTIHRKEHVWRQWSTIMIHQLPFNMMQSFDFPFTVTVYTMYYDLRVRNRALIRFLRQTASFTNTLHYHLIQNNWNGRTRTWSRSRQTIGYHYFLFGKCNFEVDC